MHSHSLHLGPSDSKTIVSHSSSGMVLTQHTLSLIILSFCAKNIYKYGELNQLKEMVISLRAEADYLSF